MKNWIIYTFWPWFKSAAVRAIKTACQAFLAVVGTTAVTMQDVNWTVALSSAGLAAILSLVTSVAGIPEVKKQGEINSLEKQLEDANSAKTYEITNLDNEE